MEKSHLILLHGWGGSKKSLESLANNLQNFGYTTHVLEMPGHGSTKQMGYPWSMKDFSKWLYEYIKKNEINNFSLIGHSFGGRIILEYLTADYRKPNKIFLINISGIRPKNSLKKRIFKLLSYLYRPFSKNKFFERLRILFYKYVIQEKDYIKTSKNLKETFKIINEAYYDNKIDKVNTETILIWGKDDTSTPLWMGKKLNKLIKNSKLFVLEGTHGLPIKSPNEVSKLIANNL